MPTEPYPLKSTFRSTNLHLSSYRFMHSFFIHSSFIFHTKLKQFSAHIHCQYHEHITPNMQDISQHKNGKNLSKLISLDSWTQVYDQINPENANNYFLEISQSYYHLCFPLSKRYTISNNSRKDWCTPGIVKSCKTKCKLYEIFMVIHTSQH